MVVQSVLCYSLGGPQLRGLLRASTGQAGHLHWQEFKKMRCSSELRLGPFPGLQGLPVSTTTAKGQSLQEAESTRCTHPSSHPETPGVWPTAAPLVGSLEAITGIPGLCLGLGDGEEMNKCSWQDEVTMGPKI